MALDVTTNITHNNITSKETNATDIPYRKVNINIKIINNTHHDKSDIKSKHSGHYSLVSFKWT